MKQTCKIRFYRFRRMQWETDGGSEDSEILLRNSDLNDVLLFSHHTSSMKHHLTETHGHNFESHNIVLFSQSISLSRALSSKLSSS